MDVTCLVHRGPSSYVLTVAGGHKMEDLKAAMAAHSSLHSVDTNAILQVHNKTFNTFVNIDENTTLDDNCVIRILDVCILADGNAVDVDAYLNSSFSSEGLCDETTVAETTVAATSHFQPKGTSFSFPKMPLDISARLACCKDRETPEPLRRRIIDWLWFELSQYTLYPGHLYETAARELVQRYPQLKDGFGEGHMTWQTTLKYKAKNTRKKLPAGIKKVDEEREKARKRSKSSGTCDDNCAKTAKSQTRKSSFWNFAFDGEDEKSIQCRIEIMKKEMRLAGGNAEKIKESMEKTFQRRRVYLDLEKPSLTDLLQVYPALTLERELLNEFYRLTGVNAKEALLTLVRKHGQQILALAPSSSRPDVEDPDNPYHCTVAVLMSVPRLVKEDPTAIITQLVPGESHVYPKQLHSADHPATSSALLVAFETLQLNALDIVDGVALVLAVFWAFNIQYTPKAKRTCLLLEALMGLQPTAFAPSVVKVATAIMRGDSSAQ